MTRRRHEVDAVGVRLDRNGAESLERAQDRGDHGPPFGGHAVGGVEVVPVAAAEREIAVERVDQDLEGLLERPQMRALRRLLRLTGQPLGAHAEVAQVLQELGEDPERVGNGRDGPREHERRIE